MLDKKYFMLPLKVRIVLIIFNVSPIPVFYMFFFFSFSGKHFKVFTVKSLTHTGYGETTCNATDNNKRS